METAENMDATILSYPTIDYKGKFPLPIVTTVEYVDEFREMEVRKEDIFIVAYPKSGSHWLQEVVHLIFADGDVSKIGAKQRIPSVELVDVTDPGLVAVTPPVFRQRRDAPSPRVFTTHLPSEHLPKQIWQKECKVIYLYRHPKDVICSFYHFYLKAMKLLGKPVPDTPEQFERLFQTALRGKVTYGNWFDHILDYCQHRDKSYFLFISYEEMKKDISSAIKRLSSFIGHDVDGESLQRIIHGSSFDAMKENFEKGKQPGKVNPAVLYMHKGTTGQWKTHFTKEQNAQFDKIFREKMKDCELTRHYSST